MARPKKPTRAKEPVRIRFKELNNGNKSIYLDIYRDGKRSYEFLKLYLVPEKSSTAKVQNEQVLAAANAIKSQRIIELSNNAAGIKVDPTKSKILLRDWMQIYVEQERKKFAAGTVNNVRSVMFLLEQYGDAIPMRNIDKDYCIGFIEFLKTTPKRSGKPPKNGKPNFKNNEYLSAFSVNHYFEVFAAALNAAVRQDVIATNPIKKMDRGEKPKRPESTRTFLTIDEVKKLIETPARREDAKRAFLFACFCGLRWSDVRDLTWGNIEENNGKYSANIVMKKTKEPLYLPLNQQALSFLPERGNAGKSQRIFETLHDLTVANNVIRQWAKLAGIEKHLSFHVARHTFATTSLTLGADLYTTSKLLGHTNINITQVYAKIVNEKKDEAVALFDKVF